MLSQPQQAKQTINGTIDSLSIGQESENLNFKSKQKTAVPTRRNEQTEQTEQFEQIRLGTKESYMKSQTLEPAILDGDRTTKKMENGQIVELLLGLKPSMNKMEQNMNMLFSKNEATMSKLSSLEEKHAAKAKILDNTDKVRIYNDER